MEIPAHKKRFVLLAAFDAYEKTLAKAKKANEDAHCSNGDVDEKIIILEHLKAEYQNIDGQLTLQGTPLGDQMTTDHYKDVDGTPLDADSLDGWLRRTAGCFIPIAVISEWVLEKRKLVAAWLRGIDSNVTETVMAWKADLPHPDDSVSVEKDREIRDDAQRVGRTCAPEFIDVAWFTPPTPAEPPRMSDADVDRWVEQGPWGIISYEGSNPPGSEWELVKRDGTDEATIIDRSAFVYDNMPEARHEAAVRNRNLAEAAAGADPAALHPE